MNKPWGKPLPRRVFLRGAGITLALPFLHAMTPLSALSRAKGRNRRPSSKAPSRFMLAYVPNGMVMNSWTPSASGSLSASLPKTLSPLNDLHDRLLVISGLWNSPAYKIHNAGHHERAAAAFLTGMTAARKPLIRAGISVDQIIAQAYGNATPFSSVQLGCDVASMSADPAAPFSGIYNRTISWQDAKTPMQNIIQPKVAFQTLFGHPRKVSTSGGLPAGLVDSTSEDIKDMSGSLGSEDRQILGEYLEGLHKLETKIENKTVQFPADEASALQSGEITKYETLLNLQFEIAYYAFMSDTTRVLTFMLGDEFTTRNNHHGWSHDLTPHGQGQLQAINQNHVHFFAKFVKALKLKTDSDGSSLLDNTVCLYGAGMSEGMVHNYHNLPILIAGGEKVLGHRSGRHLIVGNQNTPMSNLHRTILASFGDRLSQFGDSTGTLSLG